MCKCDKISSTDTVLLDPNWLQRERVNCCQWVCFCFLFYNINKIAEEMEKTITQWLMANNLLATDRIVCQVPSKVHKIKCAFSVKKTWEDSPS